MYFDWAHSDDIPVSAEVERLDVTLLALLFTAHVKPEPDLQISVDLQKCGPYYQNILKSRCKKQARKGLTSALSSGGSVSAFRSRLLKCTDPLACAVTPKTKPSVARSSAKTSARDVAQKQASSYDDRKVTCCNHCGAPTDRKKHWCSCKQACYCNTSCQNANWKVHKHVCAARTASASEAPHLYGASDCMVRSPQPRSISIMLNSDYWHDF